MAVAGWKCYTIGMRRLLGYGAVMLACALLASSCTIDEIRTESVDRSTDDGSAIDWESCGNIQCGSLTVPLDHDDPTGPTIDLALTRARATEAKIGSVFMNFGGPSGESVELMAQIGEYFVQVFGGRFDVVSWDVRAVGETEPLQCQDFVDENFSVGLVQPDDGLADELAAEEASLRRLADCALASGPIIDHLSTVDVARDLDLLRAAVGDDQLTYLGFSYGTMIGWVYATLFPDNVRAMVLDGAAPPSTWTVQGSLQQTAAFERVFDEFTAWCDDAPNSCGSSDEGLGTRFDRLVAELTVEPIELGGGRQFQADDLVSSVFDTLYQTPDDIGRELDSWLDGVDNGDPSGFVEYSAFSNEGLTPGVFKAVLCADGYTIDTVEESTAFLTELIEVAPRFGLTNPGLRCDLWPGEIKGLPELDTTGAPTLLVVGNTLDPATPYESAVELDAQLADSVLLTFEGAGHTIVGANECIDAIVLDYLVSLQAPAPGERCS